MGGYNATCFAYGATGAGKTYTMMGTPDKPGVMVLTMEALFREIEARRRTEHKAFRIGMQYLEVYNETIYDLIAPSGPLPLREASSGAVVIPGLTEAFPTNAVEVLDLLARGNTNRSQSPTDANAESSRSHAVLQIRVHQSDKTSAIRKQADIGKLSLIDLAGSERAKVTRNRGERLIEGANINRSLLALGNCINALCVSGRRAHIPYRDSKLTRLLKDSLGGNCKTVMIANISPSSTSYEDTHNTLKYANRAKEIKTKVRRNVVSVERHVSEYTKIITELRSEIAALKGELETHEARGLRASTAATDAVLHMADDIEAAAAAAVEEALEAQAAQRAAEGAVVRKAQARIKSHFQKQMQLKHTLFEVEETQAVNSHELTGIERRVAKWEAVRRPGEDTPAPVRKLRTDATALLAINEENEVVRQNLLARLGAAIAESDALVESVAAELASPTKVQLVETAVRNRVLSLEKMELAKRIEAHEAGLRRKESEIDALRRYLSDLSARVDGSAPYDDDVEAILRASGPDHGGRSDEQRRRLRANSGGGGGGGGGGGNGRPTRKSVERLLAWEDAVPDTRRIVSMESLSEDDGSGWSGDGDGGTGDEFDGASQVTQGRSTAGVSVLSVRSSPLPVRTRARHARGDVTEVLTSVASSAVWNDDWADKTLEDSFAQPAVMDVASRRPRRAKSTGGSESGKSKRIRKRRKVRRRVSDPNADKENNASAGQRGRAAKGKTGSKSDRHKSNDGDLASRLQQPQIHRFRRREVNV